MSSLDINEVFDRVGEQIKRVIDFDWIDITRHVPGADYLDLYAFTPDSTDILDKGTRVPIQTGPGEVILTGRPIIRMNMPEESIVYPFELEVATEKGFRSAMFVPLKSKSGVLGSLNIASCQEARYGERELQIAQEIADHLAVVLEHTSLYQESEELAERLKTFNEVMRIAVSSLDVTDVFDRIGEQVEQLIDYSRLSIAVHSPGEDYVETYAIAPEGQGIHPRGAQVPLQPRGTRLPLHETAMGEVILTGRPILRKTAPNDYVYPHEFEVAEALGPCSFMFVPLKSKGRVIGTLNFASPVEVRYTENELKTAQEIADHLAIILEHALLYQESAELSERLKTLYELMRIATSTMDIAEVFDLVGDQIKQLIDYNRLSIAIHPPGEDYIEMYAVTTEGQSVFPKGMRLPLRQTPMGEAILTGSPILRRTSDAFVYPIEFEMSKTIGSSSFMFVPLESKGRVIGSLNVASRPEAEYTERELHTAQEIADHLAVVLEHALLYEESKQSAEILRRLNRQLDEANRHKSEFLANLSHELRTPLNAILGGSELLGEGLFGQMNEKQTEYVRDIHEAGDHLLNLINDVLDLSKVEAGKLDLHLNHFDLRSLMESSATIVRERAASKSLEFRVVPPPEDVILEADERKIKQIVYNLLSNAVKFTPENGKVVFSVRHEDDQVIFVVEDTGAGVAEELRERIFEEFFQIPGVQEGTGLGLALSKRLVELHGGRIWLESAGGKGSRFFFSIPIPIGA